MFHNDGCHCPGCNPVSSIELTRREALVLAILAADALETHMVLMTKSDRDALTSAHAKLLARAE